MIDLIVTGHAEPQQSREEIAQLLLEYGVGAVCVLRNGGVSVVTKLYHHNEVHCGYHMDHTAVVAGLDGTMWSRPHLLDVFRVYPPETRLRITVDVAVVLPETPAAPSKEATMQESIVSNAHTLLRYTSVDELPALCAEMLYLSVNGIWPEPSKIKAVAGCMSGDMGIEFVDSLRYVKSAIADAAIVMVVNAAAAAKEKAAQEDGRNHGA